MAYRFPALKNASLCTDYDKRDVYKYRLRLMRKVGKLFIWSQRAFFNYVHGRRSALLVLSSLNYFKISLIITFYVFSPSIAAFEETLNFFHGDARARRPRHVSDCFFPVESPFQISVKSLSAAFVIRTSE